MATLELHRGGASRETSVRTLVALGKDGIDPLLSLLRAGRLSEGPDGLLQEDERALLWAALCEHPARCVIREALHDLDREPSLEGRIFVIEVLGVLGTSSEFSRLLDLAADFADIELHGKTAREAVCKAMLRVLRRDPAGFENLIGEYRGKYSPTLEQILTQALAATGTNAGLDIVRLLMRDRADLRLAAIDALGELAVAENEEAYRYATELVAGGLVSRDAEIRQHAAISMGKLRSTDHVPALMDLLDDPNKRVRKRAMWALQETTGFKGREEKRWKAWYARELDWHFGEREALIEVAYSIYPARQHDALRRIGHHRVFGAELAQDLATLVRQSDESLALAAVAALHRIVDRSCLYLLIDLLEDPRWDVREAVGRVLGALSGQTLPAEREVWEQWVANPATEQDGREKRAQ